MTRATQLKAAGDWSGPAADVMVLDFDSRSHRNGTVTGIHGTISFSCAYKRVQLIDE